ncbi:hypothetical protein DY000_02030235 [Brassica cretica]|uniref:Uncharacterized protein n=1 Tax=Brassica cretica TaxID=69181 RepID=A0ABQ7DMV2_BRACR|nr:hypothetical protein DY000_02030235 [Brassica cretica]
MKLSKPLELTSFLFADPELDDAASLPHETRRRCLSLSKNAPEKLDLGQVLSCCGGHELSNGRDDSGASGRAVTAQAETTTAILSTAAEC